MSGSTDWRWQQLQSLIPKNQNGLIIGEPPADSLLAQLLQTTPVQVKGLKHQLGQETDFAIFDAELGLDADAFAIVMGMIRAGGCCYLCFPPKEAFLSLPNPAMRPYLNTPLTMNETLKGFQAYLWHSLQQHAVWLLPDRPLPAIHERFDTAATIQPLPTDDQCQAIEAICHLAFGHRKRPLVLTADRGRGKSYALGLACLRLLAKGKRHITLTAARPVQLAPAFQAMVENVEAGPNVPLKIVEQHPGRMVFQLGSQRRLVEFQAPDRLLACPEPLETDVLMIDEAAHLPLPMLQALLHKHPRVLLSSTQQGYEGSGRGFSLKLTAYLNQHFPNWKKVTLSQPIRWNPQDPLENALNQLLGFQAPSELPETKTELSDADSAQRPFTFSQIDPLALVHHSAGQTTLFSVFQLLSQAHYQTRPNDLMQLLEVPNQQLWIAKSDHQLIGVLRALKEGELSVSDTSGRQQGHLFPQLMAKICHQPKWLSLKTLRIQRLAIAPEHQNQGIGSDFIAHYLRTKQSQSSLDALTTSFGASPGLVKFWGRAGFTPVHLGIQKDKASGLHSVAMIAPFSATAQTLTQQSQFAQQFTWQLIDSFQQLDTELVYEILKLISPSKTDTNRLFPEGYLVGQPFESVSWALREWTLAHPDCLKQPGLGEFWCQKVLQNHCWSNFPQPRKQLEHQFKTALATYLELSTQNESH